MNKFKDFIKSKPHMIISLPALLCFFTFITNFFSALQDWNIDPNEYHQLLATADGFEAILLGFVAFVLKAKE